MPADTPALDALLQDASRMGHGFCHAGYAAPRLAAIVRVLVGPAAEVLVAYDALVSGKPMPSYGAIDRLRAALSRAEAIARGEES